MKIFLKSMLISLMGFSVSSAEGDKREVIQYQKEFTPSQVKENLGKVHYWGKVSSWSKWNASEKSDYVLIDKDPIYTAYSEGYDKFDVVAPTQEKLMSILGEKNGAEFYEFLGQREELEEEAIVETSAIIYESKISVVLDSSLDKLRLTPQSLVEIVGKIDLPHIHKSIEIDLAHNILEPLHSGHKRIKQNPDQKFVFSTIRLEDYGCESLTGLLASYAEAQDEYVARRINEEGEEEPVFRMYSLSSLQKIPSEDLDDMSAIFGSVPDEVYVQEVIYSSRFLKSGLNYWALFKVGEEQTQVTNYTVLAFTSKMSKAMGVFLNGVTTSDLLADGTAYAVDKAAQKAQSAIEALRKKLVGSDGAAKEKSQPKPAPISTTEVTVDKSWVDLNEDGFSTFGLVCSKGLSLGVPRYTLRNFEAFVSEIRK